MSSEETLPSDAPAEESSPAETVGHLFGKCSLAGPDDAFDGDIFCLHDIPVSLGS